MHRDPRLLRLPRVGLLVAGLAVLLAATASAAPPPPRFYRFTLENTSATTVTAVNLVLFATGEPSDQMPGPSCTYTFTSLEPGESVVVNTRLFGVARIHLTASATVGANPVTVDLTANAPLGDFDPGHVGDSAYHEGREYSGFGPVAPSGLLDFDPYLRFEDGAGLQAHFAGHARYWDYWSPLIEVVQPFH